MLVWRYGPAFQPCKCPLCRRQITLLVLSEASLRQRGRPEVAEILRMVETYNHYFGDHERGVIQVNIYTYIYIYIQMYIFVIFHTL